MKKRNASRPPRRDENNDAKGEKPLGRDGVAEPHGQRVPEITAARRTTQLRRTRVDDGR